jgi:hypothetical protein
MLADGFAMNLEVNRAVQADFEARVIKLAPGLKALDRPVLIFVCLQAW